MRTTIEIDDDVLALALARARRPRGRVDRPRHLASRPHGAAAPRESQPPRATRRGALVAYLLDINVLIALLDAGHVQHEAAHQWLGRVGHSAWATCPLAENGVVRIVGSSRDPNPRHPHAGARARAGTRRSLGRSRGCGSRRRAPVRAGSGRQTKRHGQDTRSSPASSATAAGASIVSTFARRLVLDAVPDGARNLEVIG